MSKRHALLAALLAAILLAGFLLWPEPARADFGASARFGEGGGAKISGRAHVGDAGFRGGVRFGRGDFGRGGLRGRDGHARRGAMLGDRFRVHQRARLAGIPLRSSVLIGDAELIAQRRRFRENHLPHHRHDRRFAHKRWGAKRGLDRRPFYYPWALGVPGDDPPVIIVQVMPPAPAPAAQPAAAPPQPLDPRGRIKVVGEDEVVGAAWSEGDVLPDSVPHVTLDHLAYGLPLPPLGEKYARVGSEVLRIDAGSRRIVEVMAH